MNSLPVISQKRIRNKMLSFLAYEYEAIRESNVYSTLLGYFYRINLTLLKAMGVDHIIPLLISLSPE